MPRFASNPRDSHPSLTDQKWRRENALPEPDLRYDSNVIALLLSRNATAVSILHGRHFEVCGHPPSLCFLSLASISAVHPTIMSCRILFGDQDVDVMEFMGWHAKPQPRMGALKPAFAYRFAKGYGTWHPSLLLRYERRMAEREGFEPPEACASPVFKTGTLNHSDISPVWKTRNV